MYNKKLFFLSNVFLNTKKITLKTHRKHILLILVPLFFVSSFLRTTNCVKITIYFGPIDNPENPISIQTETYSFLNPYNQKINHNNEPSQHSNNPDMNQCLESVTQEEYNRSIKNYRLETNNEKYMSHTYNVFPNLSPNTMYYDANIAQDDLNMSDFNEEGCYNISSDNEKIITPEIIYFDSLNESNPEETYVNIKDITESNIDHILCEICLNILYFGWNIDFPGLRNEQFLDFIWFFYDLSVYSESDELDTFYKNLLPFLFSYMADKSCFNVFDAQESEFSKYRNFFLPFLVVLYDSLNIYFNSNTKELCLIEKKLSKKCDLVGLNSSEQITIRTTPFALIQIKDDNTIIKKTLFLKLLNFHFIYEIRISNDDRYYSEYKDSDSAYDFLKNNSSASNDETYFFSVFNLEKIIKNVNIKFIEFERVNLSSKDLPFLQNFRKLESLILVKCSFDNYLGFLNELYFYFPNLEILRIINAKLRKSCLYVNSFSKFRIKQLETLKKFKIDYSCLDYILLEALINHDNLEVLSMRGVVFFSIENFFRACSKLIRILNQPSLNFNTKKLSLSGNEFRLELIHSLKNFEFLECLNLSNLKTDLMKDFDCDCRFKHNLLSNSIIGYLSQFSRLEYLNLSDCDLDTGFVELLCTTSFQKSLKKPEFARNKLNKFDIYKIYLLTNIRYITVSFDAEVFSDFLKTYGFLEFLNLETIIFVATNFVSDICNFVMIQPSLKNLELLECEIEGGLNSSKYGVQNNYENHTSEVPYFSHNARLSNTRAIRKASNFILCSTARYYNEKFGCTETLEVLKKLAKSEMGKVLKSEENRERRRIATSVKVCYDEATRKEKPRSAWKENIESKISKLDLSKDLLEKACKQEKLSTSETKSLKKIMREFNLNLSSVTDLSEALKKITMHESRKQFRKENRMFELFRGRFYRGLSERVESEHVVSRDETVSFWSTI
ncbi:hypothetical protein CWI38_1190p0020 [Hamiltosporidium tvaerminnensis]|uniref:Leucine-rich repeat-containing protein n=1 Tax=Hamiltosporidium tvaerminnensis TaxID=1176355 RepID=A0A4Q9LV47_9MICR|nr:hypothetical protein CWI38_1190p0020 [Hamiltosporidium tvaerminnensis]